jgi:flagellar protein FlgJ
MIDKIGASTSAVTGVSPQERRHASLRKAAEQLEGVFVQQLFKAMRDTVPQGEGIVTGGSGEDIFTGLLDEHLAAETPKQWEGGFTDALYRQLSRGLSPEVPTVAPASVFVPNVDPSAL